MYKKIKIYVLIIFVAISNQDLIAQQGFGTNQPNKSSVVEMKSDSKGLLIPRVELTSLNDLIPITGNVADTQVNSLLVYNLTTDVTKNLIPGFYYWMSNGTSGSWVKIATSIDAVPETITYMAPSTIASGLTGRTIAIYENESGTNVNIQESVTKIELNTETIDVLDEFGDPLPGQVMDIHTLRYIDETGTETDFNMSALVAAGETLTSLSYDGSQHSLIYTDEKKNVSSFNMIDLVGEAQMLTTLQLDLDNKRLEYKDENEQIHSLNLAPIIQEPWYKSGTSEGATSNTDNIFTQGWVGIGYTTPSVAPNEKLRVNGTISTVNNSYADYVFEDYFDGFSTIKTDYKFKSLEEVDQFIKINKHLPGITPIHMLEKTEDGYAFNISELSIQLLEKTEELYLHTIEQEEKIKKHSQEIESLKTSVKILTEQLEQLIKSN